MGVLQGHGRPNRNSRPRNDRPEDSDEDSFFILEDVDLIDLEEFEVLEIPEEPAGAVPRSNAVNIPASVSPRKPKKSSSRPPKNGHILTLKKGRRSKQRYENEKRLLDSNFDPEKETAEDWLTRDIVPETRSRFRDLLEQSALLDLYLDQNFNNEESEAENQQKRRRRSKSENSSGENETPDPETAFLRVSQGIRGAVKKHWPKGMIEGLENEIREFFLDNPTDEFVKSGLSSYERLLAHACSSYHNLTSRSFDEKLGVRTLAIENPRTTFKPMDPTLAEYLDYRYEVSHKKQKV